MTIQEQLEWLTSNTTVLWVERHDNEAIVTGTKIEIDRYERDQGIPISFSDRLEPYWQTKFDSFTQWNPEREKYRILYDTMRAFFISFIGLRMNKVASIETRGNIPEKIFQGDIAGSLLIQMYVAGKKAIDLMTALQIIPNTGFERRFSETRNKLFEHNHNPGQIIDLMLEPSFWDLIATKSLLPVYVHTTSEREYEAYIDYYQDYYDLEQIFVGVVENFT